MWHATVTPSTKLNEYTTILSGPGYEVKQRSMAYGQYIEMEVHENATQIVTPLMGRFRVSIVKNGVLEAAVAAPGDIVAIDAGIHHEISCIQSGVFTSTYLFIP